MTFSPPGTVTGAGTANTVCKFTAPTVIADSQILDDLTTVTIATRTTLHAAVDVNGLQNFLKVTGTLPANPNVQIAGVIIDVTGAGAAAQIQDGFVVGFRAGYTGAANNHAIYGVNLNNSGGSSRSVGVQGDSFGSVAGGNSIGVFGQGLGVSAVSMGAFGFSNNGTKNIGVLAIAQGGTKVGLAASFNEAGTTSTLAGCAILADNVGDTTLPIALFRANTATKVAVSNVGSLDLSAGTRWPISTRIANYPLTDQDITILADASALGITMTLPAAAAHTGRMFNIKKIDATANLVTIASAGGLIDGLVTQSISAQWDSFTLQSNGTDWFII